MPYTVSVQIVPAHLDPVALVAEWRRLLALPHASDAEVLERRAILLALLP